MKTFLAPLMLIIFCLLALISKENSLMELRLQIPRKESELTALNEEAHRLEIELDTLLSPKVLLEKINTPQYSHLTFPENAL